eukprot:SAG11_NODE_123_length_15805_cov_15.133261_6_plen_69_part_00
MPHKKRGFANRLRHDANINCNILGSQALDEMVAWANANGTAVAELIHLGITDIQVVSGVDVISRTALP